MNSTPKFLLTNALKEKGTNKHPKLKEGSQTAIKSQLFFPSNFAIFKMKKKHKLEDGVTCETNLLEVIDKH